MHLYDKQALISKIILLLSSLIPISSVQVAAQNYLPL